MSPRIMDPTSATPSLARSTLPASKISSSSSPTMACTCWDATAAGCWCCCCFDGVRLLFGLPVVEDEGDCLKWKMEMDGYPSSVVRGKVTLISVKRPFSFPGRVYKNNKVRLFLLSLKSCEPEIRMALGSLGVFLGCL